VSRNVARAIYYSLWSLGLVSFAIGFALLINAWLHGIDIQQAVADSLGLLSLLALTFLRLGFLPYGWIRRDFVANADAENSPVRSVILNSLQGVAALVALFYGTFTFGNLSDALLPSLLPRLLLPIVLPLSITVSATAVFVLVEIERGHVQSVTGASQVAQRLHLYTVQAISVGTIIATGIPELWSEVAIRHLMVVYVSRPLADFVLPVLWAIGVWLLYIRLARGDTDSTLRLVVQFFGFGAGLVCLVESVRRLAYLGALLWMPGGIPVAGVRQLSDVFMFIIVPSLIGGLLTASYGRWLVREAGQSRLGRLGTSLAMLGLVAAVLGAPFYFGVALLLRGVPLFGASPRAAYAYYLTDGGLAVGVSLLVAGLLHYPLAIRFWRRCTKALSADPPPTSVRGARQVYLELGRYLGFLAMALTIGSAIVGSSTVLRWLENVQAASIAFWNTLRCNPPYLSSQPCSPQPLALSNALYYVIPLGVAGFVAGIHYYRLRVERIEPPRLSRPEPPGARAAAILGDLRAGRTTRDEAMTQLQALVEDVEASGKPR
jgi:hypothetical protein